MQRAIFIYCIEIQLRPNVTHFIRGETQNMNCSVVVIVTGSSKPPTANVVLVVFEQLGGCYWQGIVGHYHLAFLGTKFLAFFWSKSEGVLSCVIDSILNLMTVDCSYFYRTVKIEETKGPKEGYIQ